MEVFDIQEIQKKKDYSRGEKTTKILNLLNSYGMSDYWIAQTIMVYQSYISKWRRYKSSEGSTPRIRYYVRLRTLLEVAFNYNETHGEVSKERVQQLYKKSTTYEVSEMFGNQPAIRRPSYSGD